MFPLGISSCITNLKKTVMAFNQRWIKPVSVKKPCSQIQRNYLTKDTKIMKYFTLQNAKKLMLKNMNLL